MDEIKNSEPTPKPGEMPESTKLTVTSPPIRDYWKGYHDRVAITVISVQTAVIFFILLTLDLSRVIHIDWVYLILLTIITAGIMNAVTILLLNRFTKPFHDILNAVVVVSGEKSTTKAPNPNDYNDDRYGFRNILQTIYSNAVKSSEPQTKHVETRSPQDNMIIEGTNHMAIGIAILDSDKHVIYHNEKVPVVSDKDNYMTLDMQFPEGDTLDKWLDNVSKNKLRDEHQWNRIANNPSGDSERKFYDVTASYHRGSVAETVITMFDKTSDYTPEEDDLEFIAFAAHELRGPITVIRGYLDVLQDELGAKMESDQKELMRRLVVSANRLDSYVNNILNASRYDRRHLKLHLVEDNVKHIYDIISDDMEMRAQAQNRVLAVDIPENLPTVAADANSISEVLGNLIDNAIKYSNEGGLVRVEARAIPNFIEINVRDRGIGMPANVLQNLFHKFYRSHRSRETVAGTGIGLYICKAIVSSHGGTITATSSENEGSTFSFTLPTYDSVAEKLSASKGSNEALIEHGKGWIKNHSLYRG